MPTQAGDRAGGKAASLFPCESGPESARQPGRRESSPAPIDPIPSASRRTQPHRMGRSHVSDGVPADPRADRERLPPFERLVELHGPRLLRFCAAQAGPERAEDCFQDTMLAALRAYGEVRDPSAVRPWLFSIAVRKAIDSHRSRARAPEPVEELEPLALAEEPDSRDGKLWARVRRLPEKQRQAVTLRYMADLSPREIAAVMQTSEPSARRSVFEGLKRLRGDLQL